MKVLALISTKIDGQRRTPIPQIRQELGSQIMISDFSSFSFSVYILSLNFN